MKPLVCLCLMMMVGMVAAQAQGVDARTGGGRQFAYFIAPFEPYTGPPYDSREYRAQSDRSYAREHQRRPARSRDPGQRPHGS